MLGERGTDAANSTPGERSTDAAINMLGERGTDAASSTHGERGTDATCDDSAKAAGDSRADAVDNSAKAGGRRRLHGKQPPPGKQKRGQSTEVEEAGRRIANGIDPRIIRYQSTACTLSTAIPASHYATHDDEYSHVCSECIAAKQRRNYARGQDPERKVSASEVGHVTVDWFDTGPRLKVFGSSRYSLYCRDAKSHKRSLIQCRSKQTKSVVKAVNRCIGNGKLVQLCGDNAPEFHEASHEMTGKDLAASIPYRPTSNSIERDILNLTDAIKVSLLTSGLEPYYSHLAGRCWAQNMNVSKTYPELGNLSPHDFLNPKRPFKQVAQPFGRNCTVVPPKALLNSSDKPLPRGREAIFVGWHEHDSYMDGSCYIMFLDAVVDKTKRLSILRTRDIRFPKTLDFPVRRLREAQRELQFAQTHEFVDRADFLRAVDALGDPKAKVHPGLCEIRRPFFEIEDETDGGIIEFSEFLHDANSDVVDSSEVVEEAEGPSDKEQFISEDIVPDRDKSHLQLQFEMLQEELDKLKSRGGGTDVFGKTTGRYKDTKRPTVIPSQVWQSLGPSGQSRALKKNAEDIQECQKELERVKRLLEKEQHVDQPGNTSSASSSLSQTAVVDQSVTADPQKPIALTMQQSHVCSSSNDQSCACKSVCADGVVQSAKIANGTADSLPASGVRSAPSLLSPLSQFSKHDIQAASEAVAVVEFACHNDSKISANASRRGVSSVRLTKDVCDLRTDHGIQRAVDICNDLHVRGHCVDLWGSLPCKPWSKWNVFNARKLGKKFREYLKRLQEESVQMIRGYFVVAEAVIKNGGHASYEWPAFCGGWELEELKAFFKQHSFLPYRVDGCAVELQGKNGKPIKKPWLIMSTNVSIGKVFEGRLCNCPPGSHTPCQGSDTVATERYTEVMAELIVDAALHNKLSCGPSKALLGCSGHLDKADANDFALFGDLGKGLCLGDSTPGQIDQKHRQKVNDASSAYNLLGLVTRIIHPNSKEFTSPPCLKARDTEVTRLRKETVWNEKIVREWSEVKHTRKNGKPPMVGDVFLIMGQKNAELVGEAGVDETDTPMKARAVFRGSDIRTGDGTPAHELFQEVGATPSNMVSCKMSAGCAAAKGHVMTTRDAEQAYIQSYINTPGRPETWVRLPKSWWPPEWFNPDGSPKYKDPVCLLEKSLYGHPESGPLWDKKLHVIMKKCGYLVVEASPGVFYNPVTDVEVNVYVDDFVVFCSQLILDRVWQELDQHIKFKDPHAPLERYLGVYFERQVLKDGTIRMLTNMRSYLVDAVKTYMSEKGVKSLPYVATPYLDEVFTDDPDKLVIGEFSDSCASHLMKVLFSARMVRADLIVATTLLARRVAKWYSDEDRRLHRLMCYIFHHAGLKLVHEMNPRDLNDMKLVFYPDAELGGDVSTTKATYGMWLELTSQDESRCWPVSWFCRKSGHSPGSTADVESTALVGAADTGLKREVIPVLEQCEVSLQRSVQLIAYEDNTQAISFIRKGYSPALRYLQRHCRQSLGFVHECFYPDSDSGKRRYDSSLKYCESKKHKGDWMTKILARTEFVNARQRAGFIDG